MFNEKKLWVLLIAASMPILASAQFDKLHINAGTVLSSGKLFSDRGSGGLSAPSSWTERLRSSPGLMARLMAGHQVSERLSVAIGLSYESSPYQYHLENFILPSDIPRGTSTSFKQDIAVTRVGIPLQLTYQLGETKRLAGIAGLSLERAFSRKDEAIVTGAGAEDPAILNLNTVDIEGFNVFFSMGMDIVFLDLGSSKLALLPAISIGLLGDQVSFTEPRKANLYRAAIFLSYTHQL